MKAVCIVPGDGGPTLKLQDIREPVPGPGQILVKVAAAGLNFADLSRNIRHHGEGTTVAGMEMAGTVVATGAGSSRFAVGDRVMAMATGTYAEYCLADAQVAMPVPGDFSWEAAAAVPLGFMTAHDALVTNGALSAGETVLIQAVTSGVGIAACQIARLSGAGRIAGTSGSDDKLARMAELGLDIPVNHRREALSSATDAATAGKGFDLIVDNVGASALKDNLAAAAVKGRIVQVGRVGGRFGEIDLDDLSRKRLRFIGVTFRTRTPDETRDVARRMETDLLPALADGRIRPVVDTVFPLADALAAQRRMMEQKHFGKIILTVS